MEPQGLAGWIIHNQCENAVFGMTAALVFGLVLNGKTMWVDYCVFKHTFGHF